MGEDGAIAVTGKVPVKVRDRIDEYAEEHGVTRSEAIRDLVTSALEHGGGETVPALTDDLNELQDLEQDLRRLADQVQQKAHRQADALHDRLEDRLDLSGVDPDLVDAFADQPYCLLPKDEGEAWIVVPRFVPFNVGWLDQQTSSYNVFVVNKYVDWIREVPSDIRERVGIQQTFEDVVVDDGVVHAPDADERDRVWNELGGTDAGLHQREGDDKIKIRRGKEFEVVAQLIEKGNLPFRPQEVPADRLRDEPPGVHLDDPEHVPEGSTYQERAWDRFTETGMIGVYWPPGAGKTFLALYAGDRVKGGKLVIVPSNTLKEQWVERINDRCRRPGEWRVETYQWFNYKDNLQTAQRADIALTIYDEVHHLPANTFSKLATIGTDYRIGLSATPYREDERTEFVFALTGYPVGLEWEELKDLGVVQRLPVNVYLYRTRHQKEQDVPDLVAERTGKIVVFCDSLAVGERLARELDAPFISGDTSNRMDKYRDHRVVVTSRVGDEGLSLPDIDTVINHDWLAGSRRQELQRFGRVLHGDHDDGGGSGEYIIQMTDEEADKHGKRLYSLEERGFEIRRQRRA